MGARGSPAARDPAAAARPGGAWWRGGEQGRMSTENRAPSTDGGLRREGGRRGGGRRGRARSSHRGAGSGTAAPPGPVPPDPRLHSRGDMAPAGGPRAKKVSVAQAFFLSWGVRIPPSAKPLRHRAGRPRTSVYRIASGLAFMEPLPSPEYLHVLVSPVWAVARGEGLRPQSQATVPRVRDRAQGRGGT